MLNNRVDAPRRACECDEGDRDEGTAAKRSTLLVGAGRAYELAALLDTVAHAYDVTSGHELTTTDGRWQVDVRPDGSVDVVTADGCAVLRGRLAAPPVVAALLEADWWVRAATRGGHPGR